MKLYLLPISLLLNVIATSSQAAVNSPPRSISTGYSTYNQDQLKANQVVADNSTQNVVENNNPLQQQVAFQAQNTALSSEATYAVSQINGTQVALATQTFEAENRALKAQVSSLQTELTALHSKPQPQTFEAENRALKAQVSSLQTELTAQRSKPQPKTFEAENKALTSQVATLQTELATQRSKPQPKTFEAENNSLNSQIAFLQSDLSKSKAQSINSMEKSQAQLKQYADSQESNTQLQSQVTNLQAALLAERNKVHVSPYEEQSRVLSRQLADTHAQLKALQSTQVINLTPEQENQKGIQLFQTGDYDGAFPYFRRSADGNDSSGMTNLAMMYLNGYGVKPSLRQTEALLKRASSLGNVTASENLGKMYQNALGVIYNPSQAIWWYQIAFKQGSTSAQEQLRILGAKGL